MTAIAATPPDRAIFSATLPTGLSPAIPPAAQYRLTAAYPNATTAAPLAAQRASDGAPGRDGPQPPDAAQAADAVGRYQAYRALQEFRARSHDCLTGRPDASFELADAILCADHGVTSLVQLSLVPEFRRGHGALYDALAAGQIDEETFAALLTATLQPLVDGGRGPGAGG